MFGDVSFRERIARIAEVFFSQQNKICPFPKQDSCTYFWHSLFVLMTTNAELQQPQNVSTTFNHLFSFRLIVM
jgi:hypothetical protein